MPIVDKIISNQLDIFRLTAGERKKAIKLLKKMQAELNGKLAAGNLTSFGKLKTNQLLKETTEIIDDYYLRIQKGIDEIMPKLAQHTADVTVESFVSVNLGASLPTENVIKSLLSNVLIQGAPSKDWWAKQSEDTAFKFSSQVRQGIIQGETNEQIRKRIQPILDVSQRNAAALVHTSIQTVANDARLATFKANADILKGVKQLSTLDSHTSDICMAYSGASWDLEGNPINGTTLPFNGGPPRHINCLPGNSFIITCNDITGASKRWFDGEVFIINTASGRKFTSTPNHPVLTNRGWIASNKINVGDDVISNGSSEWEAFINSDNNNIISTIHDVVESLFSSGEMTPVPVPLSSKDFHGDGIYSKIAIIYSDSLLTNKFNSIFYKIIREKFFIIRNTYFFSKFSSFCSRFKSGILRWFSSYSIMSIISNIKSLLFCKSSHSSELLFASISGINPVRIENSSYNIIRNIKNVCYSFYSNSRIKKINSFFNINFNKFFSSIYSCSIKPSINCSFSDIKQVRKFIGGFTGEIFFDKVISIDSESFHGYVYNLETKGGWYTANGIITHNCRSILEPMTKSFKELGIDIDDFKSGQRASDEGLISDQITFDEYLKGKSKAELDSRLGKGRAELFREGKITLKDLIDQNGRSLTIDELIALKR